MSRTLNRARVALTALTVAAGGTLLVSPAQAATTTVEIRPADLIAPSDTGGRGVQQFLTGGVYLATEDGDDYARGRFPVGIPLSEVAAVDYTWSGTAFAPSVTYFVDADADGNVDGELRGESVYGGHDVWLSLDAQSFPASALPDDFFADLAPCDLEDPTSGVSDPCGSSGADKHGTLANWATQIQAATGRAPILHSGGYSLAGAAGSGVLTQITYGPHKYVFNTPAKTAADLTAEGKHDRVKKGNKIKIAGTVSPFVVGAKLALEWRKKGTWVVVNTGVVRASGNYNLQARAKKVGMNKFRVTVSETSTTAAATSIRVKVQVLKK